MKKSKFVLSLTLPTLIAVLFVTCEKVPDYCSKKVSYDPSCQFCFGGQAYNTCGGSAYNPLTQGCDRDRNAVGTRCIDESVVPIGTPCGGYTLTIAATPEAGGRVTRNSPEKTIFAAGDEIILSAIANDDYKFAGWAGAQPTGGEVATYTMKNGNPSVTIVAIFKPIGKGILITDAFPKEGGNVTRTPDAEIYNDGAEVKVTATPKPGYAFDGWSGAETSKNTTVTVTMNESKTLVAIFTPTVHTLKAYANPADGGAVFINGTPLTTGGSQNVGTEIVVWASPAEGYVFTNWTGTTAEFADTKKQYTTVTLGTDATITANFKPGDDGGTIAAPSMICTLTVIRGGGSVSLNPEGINYRETPNAIGYTIGTRVTATATPPAGYAFTGWSGASTSQNSVVTINMDGNKTLTANFSEIVTDLSELRIVATSSENQSVRENEVLYWNNTGVKIYKDNKEVPVDKALEKVVVNGVWNSYTQEYNNNTKPIDLNAVRLTSTAKAGDKYVITYYASYEGKSATLEISVLIVEGVSSYVDPVIVLKPYRPTLTGRAVEVKDTMMFMSGAGITVDPVFKDPGIAEVYYMKGGVKNSVDVSLVKITPPKFSPAIVGRKDATYKLDGDGKNYATKTELRYVYLIGGVRCEDDNGKMIEQTKPEITFVGSDPLTISTDVAWNYDYSWNVTYKDDNFNTSAFKYYIDFDGLKPEKPEVGTYNITYVGLGACGGIQTKVRTIKVQ